MPAVGWEVLPAPQGSNLSLLFCQPQKAESPLHRPPLCAPLCSEGRGGPYSSMWAVSVLGTDSPLCPQIFTLPEDPCLNHALQVPKFLCGPWMSPRGWDRVLK